MKLAHDVIRRRDPLRESERKFLLGAHMHTLPAATLVIGCCVLGLLPSIASAADPPLPTQFLDVAEGRIAFDDTAGVGPLVIAIPGMGDLRSEYRFLRPVLANAGYRVVTMDVRGHGESSVVWQDYSARAVGDDALALVDHVGAGPAIIMGTSFAAGAALWAADTAPAKVKGVVLFGPIVRDLPQPFFANTALNVGFAGPWRVWFWTAYWNSLFTSQKPADHASYRTALQRNLREPGRMAALQSMIKLSKADTDAIVDRSEVAALIVMGAKDPDFSDAAEEAQTLAARLNAQSLIVPGAGHYPHAETPEVVASPVVEFLHGLTQAAVPNEPALARSNLKEPSDAWRLQ